MNLLTSSSLPQQYNHLAPDGSEIRELAEVAGGGLSHCTLPVGKVSAAVYHESVDEIWYFLSGSGQVWRKYESQAIVEKVVAGSCINIPCGTSFQFKNSGNVPLRFVIATMPRWPGPNEAVPTQGHWLTPSM
jgi:Mannose-6-phosphate isomerase